FDGLSEVHRVALPSCSSLQAEDGIRARNVTGVQTCALPILDPYFANMTLSNYVLLFTGDHDYWIWFGNSLLLTVLTVVLTLVISSFVAYGFAAYDFKGKNFFFVIVLIILSIPFEVIMLPLYKQISTWGMMDSYVAVVLPFLAHASTIFFFRQYLLG